MGFRVYRAAGISRFRGSGSRVAFWDLSGSMYPMTEYSGFWQ